MNGKHTHHTSGKIRGIQIFQLTNIRSSSTQFIIGTENTASCPLYLTENDDITDNIFWAAEYYKSKQISVWNYNYWITQCLGIGRFISNIIFYVNQVFSHVLEFYLHARPLFNYANVIRLMKLEFIMHVFIRLQRHEATQRCSLMCSTSASYSTGPTFISRAGDRLRKLNISAAFLYPSTQMSW
jgi:hypothetical protein